MALATPDGGGTAGQFPAHSDQTESLHSHADTIVSSYEDARDATFDTEAEHSSLLGEIGGMLLDAPGDAVQRLKITSSQVDALTLYAAGCVREYADFVDQYNSGRTYYPRCIEQLNSDYHVAATSSFGLTLDLTGLKGDERNEAEEGHHREIRLMRQGRFGMLEQEHADLKEWIRDRGRDVASKLDGGPNDNDVRDLWKDGHLPSWAPSAFPDAGLNDLVPDELPYDLESLSPDELSTLGSIPWSVTEVDLEIMANVWRILSAGLGIEGAYVVNADGTIEINMNLDGLAGVDADKLAALLGVTGELRLTFDDIEDLEQFNEDLMKAWSGNDGNFSPDEIGKHFVDEKIRIAWFLYHSDNASILNGLTAEVAGETGLPFGELKGSLGNDYLVDVKTGELVYRFSADGSLSTVEGFSKTDGQINGEATYDPDDDSVDLLLHGKITEGLGREFPGLYGYVNETLNGTIKIEDAMSDPAMREALENGDLEEVIRRAYDNGTVLVTASTGGDGGVSVDKPGAGSIEVNVSHDQTTHAWVKNPDTPYYVPVNDETIEQQP